MNLGTKAIPCSSEHRGLTRPTLISVDTQSARGEHLSEGPSDPIHFYHLRPKWMLLLDKGARREEAEGGAGCDP